MDIELKMPDLATTDSSMKVVRWLIDVGQPVKRGQALLEVETDKALMEVEAVASGRLGAVHVQPGDVVDAAQLIATIQIDEAPVAPARREGMFARNRTDAAKPEAAKAETETREPGTPLSATQQAVARRLLESKRTVPHFYLQTSANAEPIVARRQAAGRAEALVWDAWFVHAAAKALGRFERMGWRYDNDRLRPSEADAIGVAVDHGGELFVISLGEPARKTPAALSDEIRAAVGKLRAGDPEARRLKPAKLTVTNLGATGIESFAAIVNPPESAILAIGRIAPVAVVAEGKVVPQQRVSLGLSVDHRAVNGKYAAEFLQAIVQEIESF